MFERFRQKIDIGFKPWHQHALIFLLLVLLYGPTVFYKYTYFDDYTLIVQDAGFITNIGNLLRIFSTDVFRADTIAYRPLLVLSLMIDAQIGGISPWIFHLGNILIHMVSALLLLALLRKISCPRPLSLILTLFFLVHPALVQAVAWIPGRNDSLLGSFILISLLALVNFGYSRSWGWFGLHILALLAALFTKEAALVFPAVAVFCLFSPIFRTLGRLRFYLLGASWVIIVGCWFILRSLVVASRAAHGAMVLNTPGENLQGILGYIGKMLLPFNLSVIPTPTFNMVVYGTIVMLCVVIVVCKWGVKDQAIFATGLAMIGLFLLPHLLRGTQFANYLEHRLYLSLLGFILSASQLKAMDMIDWRKKAAWVTASVILFAYATLSVIRLPIYYDQFSLLLNLIEKRPGLALSYQHMGYIFTESGEFNKAQLYYNKALELEPANKDIFHSLGVVYESQRQWQKAEQSFLRGLELAPRSSSLRYNLAYLYHQTGRAKEAERQYKLAIISRPENTKAQLNLGMLYHQQGSLQKAERQYRRVLEIEATTPEAWYNLGIIFRQRGMIDSSRPYIERAVQLKPELKDINKSF